MKKKSDHRLPAIRKPNSYNLAPAEIKELDECAKLIDRYSDYITDSKSSGTAIQKLHACQLVIRSIKELTKD